MFLFICFVCLNPYSPGFRMLLWHFYLAVIITLQRYITPVTRYDNKGSCRHRTRTNDCLPGGTGRHMKNRFYYNSKRNWWYMITVPVSRNRDRIPYSKKAGRTFDHYRVSANIFLPLKWISKCDAICLRVAKHCSIVACITCCGQ